ncbi:hypothetical protein FIE12Z_12637, partial [Fusarium flagelliforme]
RLRDITSADVFLCPLQDMPELPSSDGVELKLSNSQSAPVDNNLTSVRDAFITGDPDDAGLYEEAVDTVNLTQHNDEDSELPPLPLHEYRASTPISPLSRGSDSALSNRYEASASPFGLFTMQKGTRGTPTESEEDVVADRSTEDPLPPEKHHTIRLPAGDAQPRPTESEEDVVADRAEDDPLRPKDMARNKTN